MSVSAPPEAIILQTHTFTVVENDFCCRDLCCTSIENEQPKRQLQNSLVFMQMVLSVQMNEMKMGKGHNTEENYLCTEHQVTSKMPLRAPFCTSSLFQMHGHLCQASCRTDLTFQVPYKSHKKAVLLWSYQQRPNLPI